MLIFGNLYDLGTYPSLIFDIFRYIFFFIDGIIYSLIPWVYGAMYNLYDLRMLFNDNGQVLSNLVSNLSKTIYSFLALFMFFKTAVSLLTMLIDPSKIADKEKGASKIILNIFLCLVLIVAVPKVFDVARSIQTKVMENHIIEKLVISEDFGDNERYTLGHELSLSLWSVFLAPATDGTNSTTQKAYDSLFNNQDALGMGAIWPISKVLVVLNATSGIPIASDIIGKIFGGVNNLLNVFGIGTHYQLSYVWLLSTIAGGWVLWAFVKMMIDIAYRSIKLFMLELLSPIAIISYIDPASSKNGLFSKWLKETWKTYLSLFARIFVFAIVSILLRTFKLSSISGGGLSVKLFFILAAVAFFKNAPKLIDDMFGTTISKDDTKIAKDLLGGLAGAGVGAVSGGISGAVLAHHKGAGAMATLRSGLSGAWSGTKKGFSAGQKNGVGGFVGVVSGSYGTVKEQQKKHGYAVDREREARIRAYERMVDGVNQAKTDASNALDANGGQPYLDILRAGTNVYGRVYNKGLENDGATNSRIKKIEANRAKAHILHAGDEEYLQLIDAQYDAAIKAVRVERAYELAKDDVADRKSRFDQSTDKAATYVENAKQNSRNIYETMDEAALRTEFENQVRTMTTAAKQEDATNEQKIALISKYTGIKAEDLAGSTSAELDIAIDGLESQLLANYSTASSAQRMTQLVEVSGDNIATEISTLNDAQIATKFDALNLELVETTYGAGYSYMADDVKKVNGDLDSAKKATEDYAKSRGVDSVDAEYSIADSRVDARKKAAQRQNNGGNPTP